MTIEQLLQNAADRLEALDKEGKLEEFLKPMFHITRPDLAAKAKAPTLAKAGVPYIPTGPEAEKKKKMQAFLVAQGLDLDELLGED